MTIEKKDSRITTAYDQETKEFLDLIKDNSRHSLSEIQRALTITKMAETFQSSFVSCDLSRFDDKIDDLIKQEQSWFVKLTFNQVISINKLKGGKNE